jgi:hypothetical protein
MHSALQISKTFAYKYKLPGFFYLIFKMLGNTSSVRSEYPLISLHACTPSRPPYLHAVQTSIPTRRPDLQTYTLSRPPDLQTWPPYLHNLHTSRSPDLCGSRPHDLQTYMTSFTSTIKPEGRRSPCTAMAGRIAGISRMMGKS